MSLRYRPVVLNSGQTADFLTDAGGVLRIGPGEVAASFRLAFKDRDEKEHADVVSCFTRLADAKGTVWEAEAVFTPRVFMEKLIDLSQIEWHTFFQSADKAWKPAFRRRVVLTGVNDLLDDRFYRHFLVDESVVHLQFKYLAPTYDIAYLDDRRLLVRVSGLWTSWESLVFDEGMVVGVQEENDEGEGITWADGEELPPMVYELETRHLLFRNTAYLEPERRRYWLDNEVPLPLRFRRTRKRAAAQDNVCFLPFAEGKGTPP
jgi:hypothetical protein